ncbi:MAG: DUF2071 domain-containing protein [Flavobacteriales bacterium]|nr:DUF2071 domain-containing protein [Flavobacteriales bacterium]
MSITTILKDTNHRPWKIPSHRWNYYQEWNRAIFLHWKVDLELLKPFIPNEIEIDLFNGKPWVSLVAFTMEKIRPRLLPPFSPISNFDEINIRTYVKSNNKTGVYFLSIEGGKRFSCQLAKTLSRLPYRYSKIKRSPNSYQSYNSQYNDRLNIQFNIGDNIIHKTEIDCWLTERYALFQDSKKHINEYEIHHHEWPINTIDLISLDIKYSRFENLIGDKPTISQYSDGVKVIAWDRVKSSK